MSDDYSMGAALDLAGRQKEFAEGINQGAEKAGNEVKSHVGNMAQKQAAKINADKSKIELMRANVDAKAAASERNFALIKRGLTMVASVVGASISQYGERATNGDRAQVAVQNGAAAQRRLGQGGEHQTAVGNQLNFQQAKTDLDNKLSDTRSQIEELRQKYANGGSWSAEDQNRYAGLRQQERTMQDMSGQLAVLTTFRPQLDSIVAGQIPGSENRNGNDRSFHADVNAYLRQSGMNEAQVQAFQEYSRLQARLSGADDPTRLQARAVDEGRSQGLSGTDLDNFVANKLAEAQKNDPRAALQSRLDQIGNDNIAVRQMGPAAAYVNAQANLDRLQNTPGADPAAIGQAQRDVSSTESAFNSSQDKAFWKSPMGQLLSQMLGDTIGTFQELQSLNKQYVQAQMALSRASEEAGSAAKQANDMELS